MGIVWGVKERRFRGDWRRREKIVTFLYFDVVGSGIWNEKKERGGTGCKTDLR